MADDGLFPTDEGGSTPSQAATTTGSEGPTTVAQPGVQPAGHDPTAAGPPNPTPLPGEVTEAFQQVGQALQAVTQRLEALEQGSQSSNPQPSDPSTQPPTDDAFQKLYQDPAAYIREVSEGASREQLQQLAPWLQNTSNQLSTLMRDRIQSDFEGQFGEGSFQDIVGPQLDQAIDKLPEGYKGNEQYIRALTAGILGAQMQDPEGQKKIREHMTRHRQARQAPPMLTGNRSTPPPDSLTHEEKDYIRRANEAGIPLQEKTYLESRNKGNSEEDWGATWMLPDDLKPKPQNNGNPKT